MHPYPPPFVFVTLTNILSSALCFLGNAIFLGALYNDPFKNTISVVVKESGLFFPLEMADQVSTNKVIRTLYRTWVEGDTGYACKKYLVDREHQCTTSNLSSLNRLKVLSKCMHRRTLQWWNRLLPYSRNIYQSAKEAMPRTFAPEIPY